MIYGKVECRIADETTTSGIQHWPVWLTVADTTTIKQNGDVIRLTWKQAQELHHDLGAAITELLNNPSNANSKKG